MKYTKLGMCTESLILHLDRVLKKLAKYENIEQDEDVKKIRQAMKGLQLLTIQDCYKLSLIK